MPRKYQPRKYQKHVHATFNLTRKPRTTLEARSKVPPEIHGRSIRAAWAIGYAAGPGERNPYTSSQQSSPMYHAFEKGRKAAEMEKQ